MIEAAEAYKTRSYTDGWWSSEGT